MSRYLPGVRVGERVQVNDSVVSCDYTLAFVLLMLEASGIESCVGNTKWNTYVHCLYIYCVESSICHMAH